MADFNEKLQKVLRYPEMIEAIYDVLEVGKKHGDENWLIPDGVTMSRKTNFDSKNHHAAMHFAGNYFDESGLLHLKHEGVRALMEVVRIERGIVHPDNPKEYVDFDESSLEKISMADFPGDNGEGDIGISRDNLGNTKYDEVGGEKSWSEKVWGVNDENCIDINDVEKKYKDSQYYFGKDKK